MKRIMLALLVALFVGAFSVPVALATDDPPEIVLPPADTVYCLKGGPPDASKLNISVVKDTQSTTLPSVVYFDNGSKSMSQGIGELVIQDPYFGGKTLVGFVPSIPPYGKIVFGSVDLESVAFYDPGYWIYYVGRGACVVYTPIPRKFFVCTGDTEPTVMGQEPAIAGTLTKGWFWPYAVPASAGLSKTDLKNGYTLVCRLPAGWVKGDLAVSTGMFGRVVGGLEGSNLLKSNGPFGDYVPNYVQPK